MYACLVCTFLFNMRFIQYLGNGLRYNCILFLYLIGSSSSSSKNVLGSLWSIVVHGELYKVAMRNAQVLQKLFKTIYSV